MNDKFIERKIVIGLITSTEYINQIRDIYQAKFLMAPIAKRLATWCIEYYDTYHQAPGKNIETIFYQKVINGLPKDLAEEIEQDILPGLNDEYLQASENIEFLVTETRTHFAKVHLELHTDKTKALLEQGSFPEAEQLANRFKPLVIAPSTAVYFSSVTTLETVKKAFAEAKDPLFCLPKIWGQFVNRHLIRGGFVALMSIEKRGKTWALMELADRAVMQDLSVAFFQAGDMTAKQQVRRFCIHKAGTSDRAFDCGKMFQPVADCIYNQLNICNRSERECNFGVFGGSKFTEKNLREDITIEDLKIAWKNNQDYLPCRYCKDYRTNRWGTAWIEEIDVKGPLTDVQAVQIFEKAYVKPKARLMLDSYPNGTLSVNKIKSVLNIWERLYNFVADVIVIDYADLLVPDSVAEFRHQQNEIWKNLRSLSQEERGGKQPLVITATQADTPAYETGLLRLKNFSEDKRKYGHATAMFGLNQDPKDREKRIGIMRWNELIFREADYSNDNTCTVLQNLRRGLPYLESFY